MSKQYEPREITEEEANRVILDGEPKGLFWQMDGDIVVGIDNTTGDAWTEDFTTLEECLAWLNGGGRHGQ